MSDTREAMRLTEPEVTREAMKAVVDQPSNIYPGTTFTTSAYRVVQAQGKMVIVGVRKYLNFESVWRHDGQTSTDSLFVLHRPSSLYLLMVGWRHYSAFTRHSSNAKSRATLTINIVEIYL